MEKLDRIDILLLQLLQKNARLTTKELAREVNLSITPVYERVKRLEREGYIKRYAAILNEDKLNCGFTVFCCVKLSRLNREIALNFVKTINSVDIVSECYNISGEYDYLLKVQTHDMKSYQEFLLNVLGTIENLGSVSSMFIMDKIKSGYIPVLK